MLSGAPEITSFMRKMSLPCLMSMAFLWPASAAVADTALLFIIGDTGDCALNGTARVAATVRAQPNSDRATLIELGDLAYPVATRERLLECHEPYWGSFRKRLAIPGNHDSSDPGTAGFFSLFPEPLPRKVGLGGQWQLILIDSNLRGAAWDAQLKRLDEILAASQGECLVAAWHEPRWSSGKHGDSPFMQPLWERMQGKVTFTLHAHDHHFEALPALDWNGGTSANGVISFIVGNGGASLYKRGKQARSNRGLFGQWGFLRMELDGMKYRWQEIGLDGAIADSGHGTCL